MWARTSPLPRSVSPMSSAASTAEVTAGYDASSFLSRIGDDSREDGHSIDLQCRHWGFFNSAATDSIAEVSSVNDGSSFMCRVVEDAREGGQVATGLRCSHWVRVINLDCTTNDTSLRKLFYPYGGDEAFIAWPEGQLVGYVGFEMRDMAISAAAKLDAFIPCRQTQALGVTLVSLEEVLLARSRTAGTTSKKSFASLLYSNYPERILAMAIERVPPAVAAEEVTQEVKHASPSMLVRIVTSVVALSSTWIHLAVFHEALLKKLLRCVLEASEHSSVHAVNCGRAVGHLFVLGVIREDPFPLATRLLQRGVRNVSQVDGICSLAHVCHVLPFPMTKAAFWALVGQTASKADWALHTALIGHLHQLKWSPQQQLDSASYPSTKGIFSAPITNFSQDDAKQCTVYISRLHPQLQQCTLGELLRCAGPINKVRVCAGTGYNTLFAFVEMQTVDGARAALRLNDTQLMGYAVRVQPARNPIQDVLEEDAAPSRGSSNGRPCRFGLSSAPLTACISANPM